MKIWHQSFTVLSDLGPYSDALKAHFKRVARPDTEIVMHGMSPGTFPTNYPGSDIRHAGIFHLHSMQFVQAGVLAQEQGYDAYAVSTLPDPALREIRALVDIPVIGYGESSMLTACTLGRKFGVLVFIEDFYELLADNVESYGLTARFAGAGPVGFTFNDVLKGFSDPTELIEKFKVGARRLIDRGRRRHDHGFARHLGQARGDDGRIAPAMRHETEPQGVLSQAAGTIPGQGALRFLRSGPTATGLLTSGRRRTSKISGRKSMNARTFGEAKRDLTVTA